MFALHRVTQGPPVFPGLSVSAVEGQLDHVRVGLEVHAVEHDQELRIHWIYKRELFEAWRIERMAAHYRNMLMAIAADVGQTVGRISLADD